MSSGVWSTKGKSHLVLDLLCEFQLEYKRNPTKENKNKADLLNTIIVSRRPNADDVLLKQLRD
jgi:hypothetical protein